MGSDLRRITFQFGRGTEVHYLARTPEVGERVVYGREIWLVTDVQSDAVGEVVICEPRQGTSGDAEAVEAHTLAR